MLIEYLSFYLIFVIVISVLVSLIILKLKFFAPQIIMPIIIAIIILPALFVYFYFTYFNSIPEVIVPDLTGLHLEQAFKKLESLKLKGRHAGEVFDMKYPEGKVISQRPEGGRRVKIGRVVRVLTSSGKRKVLAPNLLGRPAIQAEAVLSAKGLSLGKISEDYVPELDPGVILAQNPLPNDEVDLGAYVSITVSSSKEQFGSMDIVVEEGGAGQGLGSEEGEKKDEGGFWPWW